MDAANFTELLASQLRQIVSLTEEILEVLRANDACSTTKVEYPGEDSEPAPKKSSTSQSVDQDASQQGIESADVSFQDESKSKEVNEDSVGSESLDVPKDENSASRDETPRADYREPAYDNSAQSPGAVVDEKSLGESVDEASIPQEAAAEGPDEAINEECQDSNSQPEPMDALKDAPAFDQNSSSQTEEPESMDVWPQPDFADKAPERSFHIDDSNAQDDEKKVQLSSCGNRGGRKKGRYKYRRQGGYGVGEGGRRDRGNGRRGNRAGWRDNKGAGGGLGKDNRGGRGRDNDRGGDRDKRYSGGNWSNQRQGYYQGWGGQQGNGNQPWSIWQGYNQNNQWKNYQQPMGQGTIGAWPGLRGWGNQAQWANWNQQNYNQGWGQQGWGQQ